MVQKVSGGVTGPTPCAAASAAARACACVPPLAVDAAAAAYPWLPVRLRMRDRFDSAGRAARLPRALPALSIHGRLDDIAPIELGRRLHAALPEGAAFVELPDAGHNDVPYQDPAAYLKAIAAFFERLDAQ